jgi:hypothetical protein
MPHAGHGKESKDSDEHSHSSPDYLRRQYEELSELPSAMSGVIGPTPDMVDDAYPPAATTEFEPYTAAEPKAVTRTGPLVTSAGPQGPSEQLPAAAPPAPDESPMVTGKGPLGEGEHASVPTSPPPVEPRIVTGKGPLGDGE